MKKTPTGWELPYTLGPGNYEYYYVVDGKLEVKMASPDSLKGSKDARNFSFVLEPNHEFRLKKYEKAKTVYLAGDLSISIRANIELANGHKIISDFSDIHIASEGEDLVADLKQGLSFVRQQKKKRKP
jgi:hypothetical protein